MHHSSLCPRRAEQQVVVLLTFKSRVVRIMHRSKLAMDARGIDFRSYTWIAGAGSTEDVLLTSSPYLEAIPEVDDSLLEGLLGVSVVQDKESQLRLQVRHSSASCHAASAQPFTDSRIQCLIPYW